MHQIIDTAPADHVFTGGWLGNLLDPAGGLRPDYLCGQLTWDGRTHSLNWYHWDGSQWQKTILCDACGFAVGMAAADLTGSGRADVVAVEWPVGGSNSEGYVYWFEQPREPFGQAWDRHVLATGWSKAHDLVIGDIAGADRTDVLVRLKDGRISWFAAPADPRSLWTETVIADEQIGDGTALWDITGNGGADVVTGAGFYENVDGDGRRWRFHPFDTATELGLDPETRVVVGGAVPPRWRRDRPPTR
jgi:hypothetical protein